MRFLILSVCLVFFPVSVAALDCDINPDSKIIAYSDLIVRAQIKEIDLKSILHDFPKHITFKILEIYKGPENPPNIITAKLHHIYDTWGPDLEEGQVGGFMFTQKSDGEWLYFGPGACSYISEKAWINLRKDAN